MKKFHMTFAVQSLVLCAGIVMAISCQPATLYHQPVDLSGVYVRWDTLTLKLIDKVHYTWTYTDDHGHNASGAAVYNIRTGNLDWLHQTTGLRNNRSARNVALPKPVPWLRPVNWGGRLYLLDVKEIRQFCNDVNSGKEPRGSDHADNYYLRLGDEHKSTIGLPSVPKQWVTYLLKHPVEAHVIAIQRTGRINIEHKPGATNGEEIEITVDAGSLQGLKIGMSLYIQTNSNNKESQAKPEEIAVLTKVGRCRSIAEFVAYVNQLKIQPGDKTSTRLPKDLIESYQHPGPTLDELAEPQGTNIKL